MRSSNPSCGSFHSTITLCKAIDPFDRGMVIATSAYNHSPHVSVGHYDISLLRKILEVSKPGRCYNATRSYLNVKFTTFIIINFFKHIFCLVG
mmetsp:Transcript_4516/g.9776  ORF Transcript_4516/g.9776 Transcript_4516/m.9776 type:complete len:93 (+) Transcript_4516:383-661(+)